MERALLGLLVGCLTMGPASITMAGNGNESAGVSLHVTATPQKAVSCVADAPDFTPLGGRAIQPRGFPCPAGIGDFTVWVVVCNGSDVEGVAGVEYGIEYTAATGSGVDVTNWRSCADLDFQSSNYPAAGGGNLAVWEPTLNCQNTNAQTVPPQPPLGSVIAIVGAFTVTLFGGDTMEIVPRQVSGRLKIGNCGAFEDDLTNAIIPRGGIAAFCTSLGQAYNFCRFGLAAKQETTWGNIKTLYQN